MKKKTLGIIIVSVLGAAAIFCSAMFTHQYLDAKNSKAAFDDLTNLITEIDEPQKDAGTEEESGLSAEELAAAEAVLAVKSIRRCLRRTTTLSAGSELMVRMSITPSCRPRTSRTSI